MSVLDTWFNNENDNNYNNNTNINKTKFNLFRSVVNNTINSGLGTPQQIELLNQIKSFIKVYPSDCNGGIDEEKLNILMRPETNPNSQLYDGGDGALYCLFGHIMGVNYTKFLHSAIEGDVQALHESILSLYSYFLLEDGKWRSSVVTFIRNAILTDLVILLPMNDIKLLPLLMVDFNRLITRSGGTFNYFTESMLSIAHQLLNLEYSQEVLHTLKKLNGHNLNEHRFPDIEKETTDENEEFIRSKMVQLPDLPLFKINLLVILRVINKEFISSTDCDHVTQAFLEIHHNIRADKRVQGVFTTWMKRIAFACKDMALSRYAPNPSSTESIKERFEKNEKMNVRDENDIVFTYGNNRKYFISPLSEYYTYCLNVLLFNTNPKLLVKCAIPRNTLNYLRERYEYTIDGQPFITFLLSTIQQKVMKMTRRSYPTHKTVQSFMTLWQKSSVFIPNQLYSRYEIEQRIIVSCIHWFFQVKRAFIFNQKNVSLFDYEFNNSKSTIKMNRKSKPKTKKRKVEKEEPEEDDDNSSFISQEVEISEDEKEEEVKEQEQPTKGSMIVELDSETKSSSAEFEFDMDLLPSLPPLPQSPSIPPTEDEISPTEVEKKSSDEFDFNLESLPPLPPLPKSPINMPEEEEEEEKQEERYEGFAFEVSPALRAFPSSPSGLPEFRGW